MRSTAISMSCRRLLVVQWILAAHGFLSTSHPASVQGHVILAAAGGFRTNVSEKSHVAWLDDVRSSASASPPSPPPPPPLPHFNLDAVTLVKNSRSLRSSSDLKNSILSKEPERHLMRVVDLHSGPPVVSKPYFEATWPRNVSVILGQEAVLRCRVRLLGDRMVSWIRQRDLHVLTSAVVSYTSDGRFSVQHNSASDDWELHISSTQARDAGYYECQVNTEPKLHWPIYLQVHSAQAQISGPSEVHVRQGSTLSLTCSLRAPVGPESVLVWYQDGKLIQLEQARSTISLATERSENFLSSRLLLPRASVEDGGNYTCVPSEALPVSVLVHVLNGEHPAAMQHGNRSSGTCLQRAVSVMSVLCFTWWSWNWLVRTR